MTLTSGKITSCLEKCGEYSALVDVMINKCLLMDKLRLTSRFIRPITTYHLADYFSLLLITCPYRSWSKNLWIDWSLFEIFSIQTLVAGNAVQFLPRIGDLLQVQQRRLLSRGSRALRPFFRSELLKLGSWSVYWDYNWKYVSN